MKDRMGNDRRNGPPVPIAPDTAPSDADIVGFPQSRVAPSTQPFKHLGVSPFAARYGAPDRQATGHWCSYCRGIWFGYLLEVTCPVCGNRRG